MVSSEDRVLLSIHPEVRRGIAGDRDAAIDLDHARVVLLARLLVQRALQPRFQGRMPETATPSCTPFETADELVTLRQRCFDALRGVMPAKRSPVLGAVG